MTEDQLSDIAFIASNLVCLPWSYGESPDGHWVESVNGPVLLALSESNDKDRCNAVYIVKACNAVPMLIAEVRELRRQLDIERSISGKRAVETDGS